MTVKQLITKKRVKATTFQSVIILLAVIFLLLAFIPIILMFILSLKSNVQIYGNFWSLPNPIQWSNYNKAIGMLIPNMINTIVVVTIATMIAVILSANAGYVFAKLDFPGKNVLFMAIISLMMVPGVLTLTPQFSLMQTYKIYNTWLALILPWVSGGQVFGIILCRTFISGLPTEILESARMDGCSELRALFKIVFPLSKPILATVAIMKMMDYYNDFIWPLMVIESNKKQVITVAIRVFQSATGSLDMGSMVAGFVFATIPMLILFIFTSRLYIEGITSGAVKG